MSRLIRLRSALPFSHTTILALFVIACAYAGMSALATVEFPSWSRTRFSPLELAIWLALFASCAIALTQLRESGPHARRAMQVSAAAVATVTILQSLDLAIDWRGATLSHGALVASSLLNATIAIIMAASLVWLVGSHHLQRWLVAALLGIIGFQLFAVYAELREVAVATPAGLNTLPLTQFFELLFIELYLVGLILAGGRTAPAVALRRISNADELGTFARSTFASLSLVREARHPPALIAFVPGLNSAIVLLTAIVMTAYAGGDLRRPTGLSRFRQFLDQISLWRRNRIDPPSYYALDLFKPENRARAGSYLTRYETKNGLFHVLNYETEGCRPKGELNDKQRFMEICQAVGIPCPATLAMATADAVTQLRPESELRTNLFCKPQRGFGAIGTVCYTYDPGSGGYLAEDGRKLDRTGLFEDLRRNAAKQPLVVQKWLTNHPSITDLADRSLLVFRVVTCLDGIGKPVVTLAMLRLLAKLEPAWKQLPDGEYAAPVELATGRLGMLTGDSPRTASLRYANHPVTGSQIAGRVVEDWPAIAAMAERVHRAIHYRKLVGWDIALTPEGPVVLEGNSNFDVMFLQRVHDAPIGETPLGPLLRPMIAKLYQANPERPPGA